MKMNCKIFSFIVLSALSFFSVEAGIIRKRSDPEIIKTINEVESNLIYVNRDEITRYCTKFDVTDLKLNDSYFICYMNEKFSNNSNKRVFYTNYQDDCIKGELVTNELYYLNDVYEVPVKVIKKCNLDVFENWNYYIVDKYDKYAKQTSPPKALPKNVSSVITTSTIATTTTLTKKKQNYLPPPVLSTTTSKTIPNYTSSPDSPPSFPGSNPDNYLPNVPTKTLDVYTTTSKKLPVSTSNTDSPPSFPGSNPDNYYLPNVPTKTLGVYTTTSKQLPISSTTNFPDAPSSNPNTDYLPNVPYTLPTKFLDIYTTTSKTIPTVTTTSTKVLPNETNVLTEATVTVTVTETPETVTITSAPETVTITNTPETVTITNAPETVTITNTPETVTVTENNSITITEKETETVTVTAMVTSECQQKSIPDQYQESNQPTLPSESEQPTLPPLQDDEDSLEDDEDSNEESEGECAKLYGRCGGIGYEGPTCCEEGECVFENDFYSQCKNH